MGAVRQEAAAAVRAHRAVLAPWAWMGGCFLVAVLARYGIRGDYGPATDGWWTVLLASAGAGIRILRQRKARPFRFTVTMIRRAWAAYKAEPPPPWPRGHYRHGNRYAASCWAAEIGR